MPECISTEEVLKELTRVKKEFDQTLFRSKGVVLLLLTSCFLLLPLSESVIVLCFVVRYFMSILVLQSS